MARSNNKSFVQLEIEFHSVGEAGYKGIIGLIRRMGDKTIRWRSEAILGNVEVKYAENKIFSPYTPVVVISKYAHVSSEFSNFRMAEQFIQHFAYLENERDIPMKEFEDGISKMQIQFADALAKYNSK